MRKSLFVAGAIVVITRQVVCARRELRELRIQHAELQARYEKIPAESRRRIERQDEENYRLTVGDSMTIQTSIGGIRLVAEGGYYAGTAIYVYLPDGISELPPAFVNAFLEETNGEFHLEPAGANWRADLMIIAGRDHNAYRAGQQGYFKSSPAPRLDVIADTLSRLIAHHYGRRRATDILSDIITVCRGRSVNV